MGLWGDIYNLWWLDLEEWSHGMLHRLVDADTGHPWEAFSFPRHSLSPPLSPLHLSRSHKFFFCFTKAHHQRSFMFAFPSQGLYYIGKAGLECINLSPHPQSAAMISQSCVNTPSTNDLWLPLTEKASLFSAHVSFFFFPQAYFSHVSVDSTWFCFSGKHSRLKNKKKTTTTVKSSLLDAGPTNWVR